MRALYPERVIQVPARSGFGDAASPAAARLQMAEYVYFGLVFYGIMGAAIGITIPLLGIGGLAGLAVFAILRLGSEMAAVRRKVMIPAVLAVSFVTIQLVIHQESLGHSYVRSFVTWMLAVIVVQALCTRPGFLRRFSMVTLLIGLSVLPFLTLTEDSRASLDVSTGLSNSNALAAWFGFCSLAFMIRGLETRRFLERWPSWAVALFSLFIVGITVSRGALAAYAVAMVVAFRTRLRRGFLPILALIGIGGWALVLGVFDDAIAGYAARGTEETGRLLVWPLIWQRFLESPLTGVGVSDVATDVFGVEITPHNGLLFIALSAGIFPAVLFLAYWVAALKGARAGSSEDRPDAGYLLPLLVYVFLTTMLTNQAFDSFIVVSVCSCMHYLGLRRGSHLGSVRRRI